ncbi:hypothetical protein E2C01_014367 [Portunus trituberculatus]|uniref:Uncharacterized protein n=1 Tax=Portunus trituberculatus TaxID=210409 RepID=A0A5B7DJT0_PORTR|nr:hypothetical protein [Portunus trituberculatus]
MPAADNAAPDQLQVARGRQTRDRGCRRLLNGRHTLPTACPLRHHFHHHRHHHHHNSPHSRVPRSERPPDTSHNVSVAAAVVEKGCRHCEPARGRCLFSCK